MPVEPAPLPRSFDGRARLWRRMRSWRRSELVACGPLNAVHLKVPSETAEAAGRRIAFFSDAHYRGGAQDRAKAEHLVRAVGGFSPHYVISGGDLAGYACDLDRQSELLNGVRRAADAVCLAVPGNWECGKRWLPEDYWRELYRESGFVWLQDEWFDDGVVTFYGASDICSGHPQPFSWPEEHRQRILLAHNPDTVVALDSVHRLRTPTPLALCGHTHGGQIRLPFLGALATASLYGHRFDYGFFERRGTGDKMIISAGVSQLSFPLRLCCPPDVLLITLSTAVAEC